MRKISQLFSLAALLSSLMVGTTLAAPVTNSNSPVGFWKTIDDVTGKPKSIIQISEDENHQLIGTVIRIFPSPGKDENEVCAECKGSKHNQKIVGMEVLSGLKRGETNWDGGQILDPENGKTYSCMLRTENNGLKLNVHGYIGMPLLGRSQVWERVPEPPEYSA